MLTYHGVNVIENSYQKNDHLALGSDLRTIEACGYKVIPLESVVDWHDGRLNDDDVSGAVAISMDDGSWFDYHDLDHPTCGMQRSMLNIVLDHNNQNSSAPPVHVTSFVIASPGARSQLDRQCLVGRGWWGDEWWRDADSSGVMALGCHSWDHVHPTLEFVAQKDQARGDFSRVDSFVDCDAQFARAGDYIARRLNPEREREREREREEPRRPSLFAHPYGQPSRYATEEYLPKFRSAHGFRAAFTTEPRAVTRTDNRWALPRLVFGRDWASPEQLIALLDSI